MDFKPAVKRLLKVFVTASIAVGGAVPSLSALASETGVHLKWEFVEGAAKYDVEISEEKTFQKIITQMSTKDSTATWFPKKNGHYFWRVRAVDSDGEKGLFADTAEIDVVVAPPVPITRGRQIAKVAKKDLAKPATVNLQWKKNRLAKKYVVEISSDNTFSEPVTQTVTGNEAKIQVPKDGAYYWRVRPLVQPETAITKFSVATPVSVQRVVEAPPPPPPPKPALTLPGDKNNSRDPAALAETKMKSPYEPQGIVFAQGSFSSTYLFYDGKSYDNHTQTTYDLIGAVARFSLGTWFTKESTWALVAGYESLFFGLQTQTFTTSNMELGFVHKMAPLSFGQWRIRGGLQYRQMPETVGNTIGTYTERSFDSLNPFFEPSFYKVMGQKLTLIAKAQISASALKLSSTQTGGNVIMPSENFALGASVKFAPTFVGSCFYNLRFENAAYSSTVSGSPPNSINSVSHMFNFTVEYGF